MRHPQRVIAAVTVVIVVALATTALFMRRPMSATDVLARIGAAYEKCDSYIDTGTAESTSTEGFQAKVKFTTAFIRPDRFRFEHSGENVPNNVFPLDNHMIVWRKGKDFGTWSNNKDMQTLFQRWGPPDTFILAISRAKGISFGASYIVPSLLVPKSEIPEERITELKDATRLEDATLGTNNCYRIRGQFNGRDTILWIDETNFLIRRIEEQSKTLKLKVTITYDPSLNVKVADEQ